MILWFYEFGSIRNLFTTQWWVGFQDDRPFLIYVFSFAFCCAFWNCILQPREKKKSEFLWKPVKAVSAPPCIASYLAVGRASLIPKRRVSEYSVIQPSTGWAWEHSAAQHRPLNKKPCCIFPKQPQSVLTFICRALGNFFCQTNQQPPDSFGLGTFQSFCQIKYI